MGSAAEGSSDRGDNRDLSLGTRPAQEAQRPHATLCSIPEGGPPASPHHPSGLRIWPEPAAGYLTPDTGHTWALRALDRGERGARLRECSSASCTEMDRFQVCGAENQDPRSGPGCGWQLGCPGLWEPV